VRHSCAQLKDEHDPSLRLLTAPDPDPPVDAAKAGRLFLKRTGRSLATLVPLANVWDV